MITIARNAHDARRDVVDRALDRLPAGAFRRVLKTAVAGFDLASLSKRAALEAVFAAAGRRAWRSGGPPQDAEVSEWHELIRLQLAHLDGDRSTKEPATPYTRRDSEELYATCWALSLTLPAPTPAPSAGWLVPGWTKGLRFADVSRGFPFAVGEGRRVAAERVCIAAQTVVPQLELQDVGEHVPLVFLPALLLDTERAWPLRSKDLWRLHAGTFEESALLTAAEMLDGGAKERLAERLWTLLADPGTACVVERLEMLERRPDLASIILSAMPAAAIERTVREDGLHIRKAERDPRPLLSLSHELRTAALRAWSARPPVLHKKWMEAHSLLPILTPEDLDLVLELVAAADYETGMQLAKFAWETSAKIATREAERALAGDAEGAGRWFWSAPRPAIPVLAQLLTAAPGAPSWRASWAHRRALDAGPAAEQLYALSQQHR